MQKVKILLTLFLLTIVFSADAIQTPKPNHRHRGGNNPVGAPLDGGLLTILGAAGVAYYVARKKKKNNL